MIMKKILVSLMMLLAVGIAKAQSLYDFTGFGDAQLLNLFYNALQQGRNYPTAAEFEAAGIQQADIAFVRSHVRRADIMSRADRVVPSTYENRNLWMNIPMGSGKGGDAGYPTANFASDVFSMWNYTNLFGSWNHSIFQAPGCWVDAAHKNGTDIMSGIKFFDTTGGRTGDANSYVSMITIKNDDGTYRYVKPLINCLLFFGSDGINYNFEASGYDDSDVVAFHKALYKEAEAQGFKNFHIGMYTSYSSLTESNVNALFGTKETGKTTDLMLNYSADNFAPTFASSVDVAEEKMGTSEGLYGSTWIVTMNRSWKRLDYTQEYDYNTWQYVYTPSESAHKIGVCLWGEHDDSRFWSYNSGSDAYNAQSNYQRLLERGFSGGYRNPANRPAERESGIEWEGENALANFQGLAQYIPERSAIQGNLPFATYFNLGNGDRWNYKGKKTAGTWYNMAAQDVVPTYRWLVYEAGTETVSTAIQPAFTHTDAYTGGSCLLLTGDASKSTDIILYKTNLKVSAGNPVAKVALKSGKDGENASALSVLVRVGGNWQEVPVGNVSGTNWQETTLSLPVSTGDVIERIGLRVSGGSAGYSMMVGKLELNDDVKAQPAAVKDLVVDVKNETKGSLTAKLYWNVDKAAGDRAAWDLLYNDEANIDHFEVLYKNGPEGRVSEVGRTTQWATVVNNLYFESEADRPFIGVRAVGADLKTDSEVAWVEVPRGDQATLPELVEEDTYGISQMDPNSAGANIARAVRYVTDFTTTGADQDLDYHATSSPADGSQYADARNLTLKVSQGQKIKIFMKCKNGLDADVAAYRTSTGNSDGLQYCFAGIWLDLDGSGTFNHPLGTTEFLSGEGSDPLGERVLMMGKLRAATPEFETTGVETEYTIPADAHVGKSRLRIVFADAWFQGSFLPTGLTTKGFSLDFNVEITGDEANQRGSIDTHDQGVADEPDDLITDGIRVTRGEVSDAYVQGGQLQIDNAEKAWIYTSDGRLVRFEKNPSGLRTASMAPGLYIIKMQNKGVIRTKKVVVK